MCMPKAPSLPPPPAALVPLPAETTNPAIVDAEASRLRRSGRSRLTVPGAGASSATGMSGLNIPQ